MIRGAWLALSLLCGFLLLTLAAYHAQVRVAFGVAFLVGFAALYLLDVHAGPAVGYHHYRLFDDAGEFQKPLAFDLVAAVLGMLLHFGFKLDGASELRRVARELLGGWRAIAFALLMLVAAAKISRPAERSLAEFGMVGLTQLVALALVAALVFELTPTVLARVRAAWERVFGSTLDDTPAPGNADRFAWTLAIASTLVAAALNVFVYERMPHVPDEVVYLFHARYLAAGELFLAPPPVPAAFDLDLMLLDQGKWYCPVPLGWPLVLALGAWAGVPWLVNPLLGGATVLVVYALLRELTSRRNARIGAALLCISPWFVFLNMSFMTHPLTLLAASCAALGVARARRTGSIASCVGAGLAIGVASLVRPLDGMLLALLLGLWSIGLGGARLRWGSIAALVASTALSGLAVLPYNRALTGEPLRFPIQRYVDVVYGPGKNDMGFGPDKGLGWGGLDPWPGHSLGEGLVTAQFNLFSVNAELFGWCTGSLALVWLWLLVARWSKTDRAMACVVAAIVGSSLLYWFNGGPDFGARYWHLILVPLLWASVRGLNELERRVDDPARVHAALALLAILSLSSWMPWRALDKYWGYRGVRGTARDVVASAGLERELVLVRGERHPDLAALAWLNPPRWDADAPIFAWARDGETSAQLLNEFSDREVRIVGRRSEEKSEFEISPLLTARAAWETLIERADPSWRGALTPLFDEHERCTALEVTR